MTLDPEEKALLEAYEGGKMNPQPPLQNFFRSYPMLRKTLSKKIRESISGLAAMI